MKDRLNVNGADNFYIEYIGNDFDYSVEFAVYEGDHFNNDGAPTEFNLYIKGSMKWDGCSHLLFGEDHAFFHLCGLKDWENLSSVLDSLWLECKKKIKYFNTEEAEN